MREGEQLPCVHYLTVEFPCVVAFPSAKYRIQLCHCSPSGRHFLGGYDHARATEALISANYRSREALIAAVFRTGFAVRVNTLGATIMRKMVRERWAVVI